MMIFFLDPSGEKIYARYGQRNARSADALQSLAGLEYTMNSVLAMHASKATRFAPRATAEPKFVQDVQGARGSRRCYHCHNVKESLQRELRLKGTWTRESAWHFPLPANIGIDLEVARGNVVERVIPDSPAARIGLRKGDQLLLAGKVPLHSIADFQYALEHTPSAGKLALEWLRAGKANSGTLTLEPGWRRSDISWRPSLQNLIPALRLYGDDLTAAEKKALGLSEKALAFRQENRVHSQAQAAGIRGGDVIVGLDDHDVKGMKVADLLYFVRQQYLSGDEVRVRVLRDGKRSTLKMKLR